MDWTSIISTIATLKELGDFLQQESKVFQALTTCAYMELGNQFQGQGGIYSLHHTT